MFLEVKCGKCYEKKIVIGLGGEAFGIFIR